MQSVNRSAIQKVDETVIKTSFQQVALVVYRSERLKKLFMARLYKIVSNKII